MDDMSNFNRKLRFGIVGCGTIGPTHAGALTQLPDAQLIAVADIIPERAKAMAQKFDVGRIYASHTELIADHEIDVVCICTPSGMHGDMAVEAMQGGKHVITEKPMEVSLEACDRMIAAEDATGKKLAIISQHRFDADTILVKKAIDDGKLGKIILADMSVKWWRTQQYYDSGDWRGTWKLDGGGALMNQGVHTVDLLQWLAGGVSSIYGHTRTAAHERIETEDIAVAALTFGNGAIGTLTATTAAFDGLPVRIDIFGTEGSAILEGDRLKMMLTRGGEKHAGHGTNAHAVAVAKGGTNSVKDDATVRTASADPGAVWGDAHRAQIQDFIRAIHTNTKPLIDGRTGRKPLEIILGVYQSSQTGKLVKLGAKRKARAKPVVA